MSQTEETVAFAGYSQPHYTNLPDLFLDQQMPDLKEAELKVMLYIFRRTYGFQKRQDAISYQQFLNGIVRQDGTRLDCGAGVSRSSLWRALKSLTEKGYIFCHSRSAGPGDAAATVYELNIEGQPGVALNNETIASAGLDEAALPPSQDETTPGSNLERMAGFKFEPTRNRINQNTESQHTPPDRVMCEKLKQLGIAGSQAERLAAVASYNRRQAGLAYLESWQAWLEKQPGVQNPAAYLRRMIEQNAEVPGPRSDPSAQSRQQRLDRLVASARKYGIES